MMIPERWPPLPVYQDTTVIETEPDHPILTKRYPEKAISFIKNSFLVIALLIASPGFAQQKTPNIVIILADDLGWNDIGFHNSEMLTPHLDDLADKGIELKRFYVGSLCSPTRAGIMTGKYPDRFGLRNVVGPRAVGGLPTEETTIAELLADAGYQHRGAFGKWHLGHSDVKYHPLRRGFTTYYGHYNGAIDYFTHFKDGAHDWHSHYENSLDTGYSVDLVAKKAVQFIENSNAPFFAYIALNAPHTPLQAKEEDLNETSQSKTISGHSGPTGPNRFPEERPRPDSAQ